MKHPNVNPFHPLTHLPPVRKRVVQTISGLEKIKENTENVNVEVDKNVKEK